MQKCVTLTKVNWKKLERKLFLLPPQENKQSDKVKYAQIIV
jgi:hypothetical protein